MTGDEEALLRRLKSVNDRAGDIALGILHQALTDDELISYATELVDIAILIKEMVTGERLPRVVEG